jgi:hypothetical protein
MQHKSFFCGGVAWLSLFSSKSHALVELQSPSTSQALSVAVGTVMERLEVRSAALLRHCL